MHRASEERRRYPDLEGRTLIGRVRIYQFCECELDAARCISAALVCAYNAPSKRPIGSSRAAAVISMRIDYHANSYIHNHREGHIKLDLRDAGMLGNALVVCEVLFAEMKRRPLI